MKSPVMLGMVVPALTAGVALAKDPDDPKPAVGPAAGITFASAIALGGYGYSRPTGALIRPAIGMSARVPIRGPWNFVPELYYTQFGQRIGSLGIAHHMIAAPLLARWDAVKHKPITPFILAGGEIAFRLKTQAVSAFTPYGYFGGYSSGFVPLEAGPVFGFGLEIPVKNVEVHFDFRYFLSGIPGTGIGGLELRQQAGLFGGIYF